MKLVIFNPLAADDTVAIRTGHQPVKRFVKQTQAGPQPFLIRPRCARKGCD